MNFPPSKRPRGPTAVLDLDPFDEDFTQDDLNEIDIIASQAITTVTGGEAGLTATLRPALHTRRNISNTNGDTGHRAALSSDRSLEAQHAQLKRKLAQVEEDMVVRSGEVRVLRDSLRAAQQEAEAQRLKQLQVQTQQQLEQSRREKELLKKVQSLESELQFKDGEINDIRSKLLSERRSSPLCCNSPKAQSSPLPSGGFITKESFVAQVKTTPTPVTTNRSGAGASSANQTPVKTPSKSHKQEVTRADPFLSVRARRSTRAGGVQLGLLLQPLSARISLCHLLSLSPHSSLVGGGDVINVTGSAAVSPVQSLALTGLNMMSLSRDQSSCPGAVLLLPLLHSHLAPLCSSVDSGLPACASVAPPCTGRGGIGEGEEPKSGVSPEERGLVALRTLASLLQHSAQAVEAVLSEKNPPRLSDAKADPVSQSALLPCVLKLCAAPHTDIACAALTTLRVLVQRSPETQQDRLRCVLAQVCGCVSSERGLKVVTSCVSVLASITDHAGLIPALCCHDPCVVLRLLQFVRSRSDPEATHSDWLQLDLKVIRLLSRVLTQSSVRSTDSTCPCHSLVVQCVVLILHRLWLDLRAQAPPSPPTEAPPPDRCSRGRVLASLRETVLLFHWLQQNHSGFTESCRGVLHLYDQVIPALRDALSSQSCSSLELALEEICRLEPDDDMDTDSG